jgi:hypothetical protein
MNRAIAASLSFFVLVACSGEAADPIDSTDVQASELNEVFRSPLHDLGQLPLDRRAIHYAEDPRPFDEAMISVSQTPGESRYVAYRLEAKQGDGLLLAAQKTTATETSGSCDEVVRIWLLDARNVVVRTGSQICESEYEVPGLQSKSNILRHYFANSGTYKIVAAVLPARAAASHAPIRTQPWRFLSLHGVRSHEENQGAQQSRCEDGIDILCRSDLRCERARCK